jgi:putative membrane protein
MVPDMTMKTDVTPNDEQSSVELSSEINSLASDVINVVRGFCMGAADTVPGVSGGTVALILGHYHRLVSAISKVDSTCVGLLTQRQFGKAFQHLDGRFLVALGAGIGIGVATLSGLMHWLLDFHMPETLAVFLGLMIASVWVVLGYIDRWSPAAFVALLLGALAAIAITAMPMSQGNTSLPYLFFSACIAICAMILPGISGAFVLLLLGVYHSVTGMIKDAARGNITVESITQMAVFGCGCIVGLLAFSRLLKWLIEHHHNVTMAALMGLMIGSLGKLWPLQVPTSETASEELKLRVMQYVSPADWTGNLLLLVALTIGAMIVVLTIEKLGCRVTKS